MYYLQNIVELHGQLAGLFLCCCVVDHYFASVAQLDDASKSTSVVATDYMLEARNWTLSHNQQEKVKVYTDGGRVCMMRNPGSCLECLVLKFSAFPHFTHEPVSIML